MSTCRHEPKIKNQKNFKMRKNWKKNLKNLKNLKIRKSKNSKTGETVKKLESRNPPKNSHLKSLINLLRYVSTSLPRSVTKSWLPDCIVLQKTILCNHRGHPRHKSYYCTLHNPNVFSSLTSVPKKVRKSREVP